MKWWEYAMLVAMCSVFALGFLWVIGYALQQEAERDDHF